MTTGEICICSDASVAAFVHSYIDDRHHDGPLLLVQIRDTRLEYCGFLWPIDIEILPPLEKFVSTRAVHYGPSASVEQISME